MRRIIEVSSLFKTNYSSKPLWLILTILFIKINVILEMHLLCFKTAFGLFATLFWFSTKLKLTFNFVKVQRLHLRFNYFVSFVKVKIETMRSYHQIAVMLFVTCIRYSKYDYDISTYWKKKTNKIPTFIQFIW